MNKLFAAVLLALFLGTFAYAAEPEKAPGAPGTPAAVTAPAAPGAPATMAAPSVNPVQPAAAPAPAPVPVKKRELKANKVITIGMFMDTVPALASRRSFLHPRHG